MTDRTPPESAQLCEPTFGVERPWRVLVAMLVYNGRSFVPRAVRSAARLTDISTHTVDVLVLDDSSPDPGWSEELAALCAECGVQYYRSPRNLGIPRNMNLALLRAESAGYDLVVLLNSDVVVPVNMADQLVLAAGSHDRMGTITAWSNAVSIFSLPNEDGERWLSEPAVVDAVSGCLADEFRGAVLDLPIGVGFCLAIPVPVIQEIGLLDPVFGRGYCEEVDFCIRAHRAGLRNVLAPSAFVFHMGFATNREAGLLRPGEQTVHVNEDIIDQRYPDYRDRLAAWCAGDPMGPVVRRAQTSLLRAAAAAQGVIVEATWLAGRPALLGDPVRVVVAPEGDAAVGGGPFVHAVHGGFALPIEVGEDGILASAAEALGRPVDAVQIHGRGRAMARLQAEAGAAGVLVRQGARYPELVVPT